MEISTAILFAYLYWQYGLSITGAVTAFYCCLFIVLMVIDLEHGLILNKVVYPSMAVALLISVFLPPSKVAQLDGAAALLINTLPPQLQLGIVSAAIGGGIGLGLFLLIVLISRGGMGWGDVKMATLIGLVSGFPVVFVALLLAVIGGGLIAGALLIFRIKKRKEAIPFAPFLSLGAIASLLFGSNILNWYLGLF